MDLNRFEFSLKLAFIKPFHIGSGEVVSSDADGSRNIPEIMCDENGDPVLVGSSLKGLLRAQLEQQEESPEIIIRLFGDAGSAGNNHAGKLTFFSGKVNTATINETDYEQHGSGYLVPSVSIDRESGTGKANAFTMTKLAPGNTELLVDGEFRFGSRDDPHEMINLFEKTIAPLACGVKAGAGTRFNQGDLKLIGIVRLEKTCFNPTTGEFETFVETGLKRVKELAGLAIPARPVASWSLSLACDGPFAIMNQAKQGTRKSNQDQQDFQVVGLQEYGSDSKKRQPVIAPKSMLGCLRSEAAWYLGLKRLNEEANDWLSSDRKDLATSTDDTGKSISKAAELASLTSVERLFGVSGWRGLVNLESLDRTVDAREQELVNVAIDRLSGGVFGSSLRRIQTFIGNRFQVGLSLRASPAQLETWEPYREVDIAFFDRFLNEHLSAEILEIGHGASKGFGWFSASPTEVKKEIAA